jgi:hypothetical protein
VRYIAWYPYPKLVVPELEPPKNGKTSWDFSLLDPVTIDFLEATRGHPAVLNLSTIPQWMFKTDQPVPYPTSPDEPTWTYQQGTEFRDPTLKEVADYYRRLAQWYMQGGFTDEYGRRHDSGHYYQIDYWEVLSEPDFEHQMTPETYTRVYDAIVEAVRGVAPQMKFVGMALASTVPGVAGPTTPRFFEYFLNPKHHKAGIPLDMISYHAYSFPTPDETLETQQYTFFHHADNFLDVVHYIESIRQRLSPTTRTAIDEVGGVVVNDRPHEGLVIQQVPDIHWNLCAALYAYLFGNLAVVGIDTLAQSALLTLPGYFPSITMLDWNTGQPNARYWVLKLLRDSFGPGDKLMETSVSLAGQPVGGTRPYVYAQGFMTRPGQRKILLVNKRNRAFEIHLPQSKAVEIEYVDQTTGSNPPGLARSTDGTVTLKGLGVAVVTLSD